MKFNVFLCNKNYMCRNITQTNFMPDSTGRLMRYDPRTKEIKVLLRGVFVAVGPAASLDGRLSSCPNYLLREL